MRGCELAEIVLSCVKKSVPPRTPTPPEPGKADAAAGVAVAVRRRTKSPPASLRIIGSGCSLRKTGRDAPASRHLGRGSLVVYEELRAGVNRDPVLPARSHGSYSPLLGGGVAQR